MNNRKFSGVDLKHDPKWQATFFGSTQTRHQHWTARHLLDKAALLRAMWTENPLCLPTGTLWLTFVFLHIGSANMSKPMQQAMWKELTAERQEDKWWMAAAWNKEVNYWHLTYLRGRCYTPVLPINLTSKKSPSLQLIENACHPNYEVYTRGQR